MTSAIRIVLLGCGLLLAVGSVARADGFTFPDLNPFDGNKGKGKAAAPVSGRSSSGLTLPKMPKLELPTMARSPRRTPRASTWQRMQKGTGDFFSSLTSWAKPAPRRDKRSAGKSPFSWLFPSSKPPRKEIRDVNDFLDLPRPEYD